jgi:excisionase family DNA binding protein
MQKQTFTIPEAAKLLGIGRGAAYEAARTGELPTIRVGRRILVPLPTLERLLGLPQGALTGLPTGESLGGHPMEQRRLAHSI